MPRMRKHSQLATPVMSAHSSVDLAHPYTAVPKALVTTSMSSWYLSSTRPRTSRERTGRSSRIQNEQMNEMKVTRMTLPTLTMPPITPFARPLASAPACWRMKETAWVSSALMLSPSRNWVEELALVTKS